MNTPVLNSETNTETVRASQQKAEFNIPFDFDRNEILGGEITERGVPTAMILLSVIKEITDHKNAHDKRFDGNAYAHLSNENIRKHFSNLSGEVSKLLSAMEEAQWLEIDHSYEVGESSKGYRIGARFYKSYWIAMEWNDALQKHFHEALQKTPIQKAKLEAMWDKAREYFTTLDRMSPGVLKDICIETARILQGLALYDRLGLEKEVKFCASRPPEKDERKSPEARIKSWNQAVEAIDNGRFYVSCHVNGDRSTERIYTNWTNLKSNFRPFFRLNGRPLVGIDIVACQPSLLASFYDENLKEDREEKEHYTSVLYWEDIYNYFAGKCARTYRRMLTRKEAKKMMFNIMFAKTHHQNKKFYEIFKEEFPVLARKLEECKKPNYKKPSQMMQLMESKIMVRDVLNDLLFEKKIDCLSIHDSIWCFEEDVHVAQESIIRWFCEEMGFTPRLRIDQNNSGQPASVNTDENLLLAMMGGLI